MGGQWLTPIQLHGQPFQETERRDFTFKELQDHAWLIAGIHLVSAMLDYVDPWIRYNKPVEAILHSQISYTPRTWQLTKSCMYCILLCIYIYRRLGLLTGKRPIVLTKRHPWKCNAVGAAYVCKIPSTLALVVFVKPDAITPVQLLWWQLSRYDDRNL